MPDSMQLLLIGPLPPPKGGVSVHLARLSALLERGGITIDLIDESPVRKAVFNLRSLNVFGYFRRFFRAEIVHIHSSVDLFRVTNALTALLLRRPFLISLHSWRARGAVSRGIHRWIFRRAQVVICVSSAIADAVESDKTVIRPAFLPPVPEHEPALPSALQDWLGHQRSQGRKVIASNAYQLDEFEGVDLYGLDLCIEMMRTLVDASQLEVALVFNVASLAKGRDRFERYQKAIVDFELGDRIRLTCDEDLSFVRLIENTDCSVRATNTDGDALSVREALSLGKPVVASDAAARPAGTRLFTSRNSQSLANAVKDVLMSVSNDNGWVAQEGDHADFYMNLYAAASELDGGSTGKPTA
ncbi:MAG: glycosyltransferase [Pseudomonadota bacterium]